MNAVKRNNVRLHGKRGNPVIMFGHGFACDQEVWRHVEPDFRTGFQTVLFDNVGSGDADPEAYSSDTYASFDAYGDDIVSIAKELNLKDILYIGHSAGAMMGVKAVLKAPELFAALILICGSPRYLNDADYTGGFDQTQVDDFQASITKDYAGWARTMAPVVMGNADRPELADELRETFMRMKPTVASDLARVIFSADNRQILKELALPTLVAQSTEDIIAPESVGAFMHKEIKDSQLVSLEATGHYPTLSAPHEIVAAIIDFVKTL